jgi:hypothetical protein
MAKSKTALVAIGTVISGGVEFSNGQEITGDIDKDEVKWLIDNGAAKQGEVSEAEPEAPAPATEAP